MPVDHTYLQYNKVFPNKHQQFHISKISGNSDLNIDASNLVIDASHISINNMLVFDFANKRINPAPPNNNGLINLGYKNSSSDRARFNEVHLKELFTTIINNYFRYRLYSDPTYSSDPFIIYSDQSGSSKFFSIDISGISTFGNNLIVNGDISANTFYGDGSNLTGLSSGATSLNGLSDCKVGGTNFARSLSIGVLPTSNNNLEDNVMIGYEAGLNISSSQTVAIGTYAYKNGAGGYNTAVGYGAMLNGGGFNQVAFGKTALYNSTGSDNCAIGRSALSGLTIGGYNCALGHEAGNTLTTGNYNVIIGHNTKTLANNSEYEVVIGSNTTGNGTNTVTIGSSGVTNTYLRGNLHINNNYSLPSSSGTSGQILKYPSSGSTLEWGTSSASLNNFSDASFNNVEISGNLLMNGRIDFFASNEQLAASDASGILTRIDNLLISYNDASFGNVEISGNLNLINLENDNTHITSDSYDNPTNNYVYGLVRINKNTGKISYCKYFPGQVIFFSDYCRTTTHDSHSLVKIFTEATLFNEVESYSSSTPGTKKSTASSVLWVGQEFLTGQTIKTENTYDKYVEKLVIPPGCPKSLEIEVAGWKCGQGDGSATMLVKRSNGSVIYNRDYSAPYNNCSITTITFYWNGFEVGDTLEFFAKMNSDNSNDGIGVYPIKGRTYDTNSSHPNPSVVFPPSAGQFKIKVC